VLETLLQPNDEIERCGLLLSGGEVVELPNIAEDPKTSFELDPEAVLEHLMTGNVRGTWHTHPDTDPNLSGEDYLCFLGWPDLEHVVIGRRDGEVVALRYIVDEGLVIQCD